MTIFDQEIDNIWESIFLENSSITNLTFDNCLPPFIFGDKIFKALASRSTKLTHFKLIDTKLTPHTYPGYLEFISSHNQFTKLSMKGLCFEDLY